MNTHNETDADLNLPAEHPKIPMPSLRTPTRVLLVEDNHEQQRLMKIMLSRLGVDVVVAENGQQGFEAILGGETAPLILMDLRMPRFDGYGATEQIRLLESKHGLQRRTIVAITGLSDQEDRQRCLDVGMDDVLTKPVSFLTLKALLDRCLPSAPPITTAA